MKIQKYLKLDPASPVPIYAQIEEQMARVIAGGLFEPGDRIPSVRELGITLQVNPLTVSKAYSRLADRGVVVPMRGKGVFVAQDRPVLAKSEREKILRGKIELLVSEARQLGVDDAKTLEMVRKNLSLS